MEVSLFNSSIQCVKCVKLQNFKRKTEKLKIWSNVGGVVVILKRVRGTRGNKSVTRMCTFTAMQFLAAARHLVRRNQREQFATTKWKDSPNLISQVETAVHTHLSWKIFTGLHTSWHRCCYEVILHQLCLALKANFALVIVQRAASGNKRTKINNGKRNRLVLWQ